MLLSLLLSLLFVQELDSCGPLSANQAAIDSKDMRLALKIDPSTESISGFCEIRFALKDRNLKTLELELVDSLVVSKVQINDRARPFQQGKNRLSIGLSENTSDTLLARIEYSGKPWVAKRPPWDGGFNWSHTDAGVPWVGVSCQGEGGQVWYPCKSHQSDKLEGVRLEITVPEPLYCAANGLLEKIEPAEPGWRTFHWATKYPIASYNVSINVADYQVVEGSLKGSKEMPVVLYMLKEYQKADMASEGASYEQKIQTLKDQAINYLSVLSLYYGDYPFNDEKFGLAHTYYLGMEHQTINSYGAHFFNRNGLDGLMIHEMAHEWWGNKLTAGDAADFWLQEGIGTYTTGVYLEHTEGLDAALGFYRSLWFKVANDKPIVQGKNLSQGTAYISDIYGKGALVIHALRWLIGKEQLDLTLKTLMSNPDHTYAHTAATEDLIQTAESISKQDLKWFFTRYIYQAKAPVLTSEEKAGQVLLSWQEPQFNMPLEIEVTQAEKVTYERVPFNNGKATWTIPAGASYKLDPRQWVYRKMSL